jgi:HlyD family secretion protein
MRIVATAAALILLAACSAREDAQDTAARARASPSARTVFAARIETASIGGDLSASGRFVAREEAVVGAEVGGYRVQRVLAEAGDTVGRGQLLAVLDGELLGGDAARARAALASAEVLLERARSEAARVHALDGTGVLADEAILARRFEVRAAEARVREARAGMRDVERRQSRLQLRAPVDGTVIARTLRPGDIAASGGEPLFRIARDALIELEAELPEADLARVGRGAAAQVTLPSGRVLDGNVRLLAPEVDGSTRLGRVRVQLNRDPELRVGGSATARLTGTARAVPTVPEGAVQYAAGATYLLALDQQDRVRRAPVRLGTRADGRVELISGPPPGTRVVLGGTGIVTPGERVRPVARPSKAAR